MMILGTAEADTALAVLGASAVNQDGRCDSGLQVLHEKRIKQPHGPGSGHVVCGQYESLRPLAVNISSFEMVKLIWCDCEQYIVYVCPEKSGVRLTLSA